MKKPLPALLKFELQVNCRVVVQPGAVAQLFRRDPSTICSTLKSQSVAGRGFRGSHAIHTTSKAAVQV